MAQRVGAGRVGQGVKDVFILSLGTNLSSILLRNLLISAKWLRTSSPSPPPPNTHFCLINLLAKHTVLCGFHWPHKTVAG